MSKQALSWNFTDAQGRCFIAGTEVPRHVYDEFERVASSSAALLDVAEAAEAHRQQIAGQETPDA